MEYSLKNNGNLRLAIQKKGRLSEKAVELLNNSGVEIENYAERLSVSAAGFPLDVIFLRDDDIPEYVQDGVADLGIVGEDVIAEKGSDLIVLKKLGFGKCRLMIAAPETLEINEAKDLAGKTIATSFPNILARFLDQEKIQAKIVELSGSVEIAPSLEIADLIFDIVSTGNTLRMNKLKKSFTVFESQAVLVTGRKNGIDKNLMENLLARIESALTAKSSRYLMMNAPKNNLDKIMAELPSLKSPTVMPLADPELVAVHAVVPKARFYELAQKLKDAGASGILLLPIESMIP